VNNDTDAAYDRIDRFLRNNLDDAEYAEYSRALETLYRVPAATDTDALVPVAWLLRIKNPRNPRFTVRGVYTIEPTQENREFADLDGDEYVPLYGPDTIERLTRERDEAVARSAPKTLEEELAALDTAGIFQDSPAFDEHFRKRISTYADKHPTLLVRQLASRLRAAWASTDEAVARERERCAAICDGVARQYGNSGAGHSAERAANAIRTAHPTTGGPN
jgi:hypothetical protein